MREIVRDVVARYALRTTAVRNVFEEERHRLDTRVHTQLGETLFT
jgi:hypothetical protein